MEKSLDLSIVIVSWNSEAWLKRCLNSIFKQTSEVSYEVILIDNNSADQSIKTAMNEFSGIKIIENKTNLGWATACNQGIEVSVGRYICLLNPDTELYGRTMEEMVQYMDRYPSIGLLGPHLMNEDGSTQVSIRRNPRLIDQLMIILKLHVLFPDSRPIFDYLKRDFNYQQTQEVEQIMGACLLLRREVVEQVGLLDETFFVWFDEVDYCVRIFEKTDYKIFYYANTHLIHARAHSFEQVRSFKKQLWYLKSLRYYFRKHQHFFAYLTITFFTPLSLFLTLLSVIFKQSKKGKKMNKKKEDIFKKAS